MLKKTLLALALAVSAGTPVIAETLKPEQYKKPHATGCMILRECKEDVIQVRSLEELKAIFYFVDYGEHEKELNSLFASFNKLGIGVFVADGKYFPPRHRGLYHTVHNKMFLNLGWVGDPEVLMDVLRHEGWHAAQDIMAGGIKNSFIGIIHSEEEVPREFALKADIAYGGNPRVLPWEREAKWAGGTPWMTAIALDAATRGPLWETYEPTPLTRKWLIEKGFLKK